jgi:hypothetical protein
MTGQYGSYGTFGAYGTYGAPSRRTKRLCARYKRRYVRHKKNKKRSKMRTNMKKGMELQCAWALKTQRSQSRRRGRRGRPSPPILPESLEDELSPEEEAMDAQMAMMQQQLEAGLPEPARAGLNPLLILGGLALVGTGLFFAFRPKRPANGRPRNGR